MTMKTKTLFRIIAISLTAAAYRAVGLPVHGDRLTMLIVREMRTYFDLDTPKQDVEIQNLARWTHPEVSLKESRN